MQMTAKHTDTFQLFCQLKHADKHDYFAISFGCLLAQEIVIMYVKSLFKHICRTLCALTVSPIYFIISLSVVFFFSSIIYLCAFVYILDFDLYFVYAFSMLNAQNETKMSTSMQSSQKCFNVDSVQLGYAKQICTHTKIGARLFLNISFFHSFILSIICRYRKNARTDLGNTPLTSKPFSLWRVFCAWLHYIQHSICNILIATKHTTQTT